MKPRERTIQVLLRILNHPYRFTRRELAQHYGVSPDAIGEDLKAIENIGLSLEYNGQYRLAILPEKTFRELKHLLAFSTEDKNLLQSLFRYLPEREAMYLRKKLDSLYDFQQLGLRALRKPALDRIDALSMARKNKVRALLKNYRSRSNEIRDRLVEPFHINPEMDTLQAYDVDKRETRHFKLARIERVEVLDSAWRFESDHRVKITDVFRIADNNQVPVHLEINVFAYNSLIEEFPLTLTYLEAGARPNTFDFQCPVNHEFKGLLNFILSNAQHVKIHSPDKLRQRVAEEAQKILERFS